MHVVHIEYGKMGIQTWDKNSLDCPWKYFAIIFFSFRMIFFLGENYRKKEIQFIATSILTPSIRSYGIISMVIFLSQTVYGTRLLVCTNCVLIYSHYLNEVSFLRPIFYLSTLSFHSMRFENKAAKKKRIHSTAFCTRLFSHSLDIFFSCCTHIHSPFTCSIWIRCRLFVQRKHTKASNVFNELISFVC